MGDKVSANMCKNIHVIGCTNTCGTVMTFFPPPNVQLEPLNPPQSGENAWYTMPCIRQYSIVASSWCTTDSSHWLSAGISLAVVLSASKFADVKCETYHKG